MAGRDMAHREPHLYTMRDHIREELRERPMTPREAAGILLGFLLVVCLLVLFVSTGSYPA